MRALYIAMILLLAAPAYADDVEQAIDFGLKAYQKGEHTKAANQLRYAAGLIGDEGLKKTSALLPQAPEGWQVKEKEREQVNFMGGFLSLVKEYHKGDVTLVVRSTADSPMFYELVKTLGEKKIKGTGVKVIALGKRPALLTEEKQGKQAALAVPLENGVLVTVTGNATAKELQAFAAKLDLEPLAQL